MPQNDEAFIRAPQFMFHSGGTLRFFFFFLTKICSEICAKFWENMLTGLWFMDKQPRSNGVKGSCQ